MVLILLVTVLVLAIAYYQVVQGLFSALIMTILTVACAGLALNTYEAVSAAFLRARQGPYADPIALTALFILPLLISRLVMDKIVAANVPFSAWADRVGGGACGLVTGMVLTGMLLIVMQMLPFGESVLGYRPFDDSLQREQSLTPFRPDEFTVGLGRLISRGVFVSDASFEKLHDDLLLESYCVRNTADKNGGIWAAPDTAVVRKAYEPAAGEADWLAKVPDNPGADPAARSKVVILQVSVGSQAKDADEWARLAGTQFRLVTKPAPAGKAKARDDDVPGGAAAEDGSGDEGGSYWPVAWLIIGHEGGWRLVLAEVEEGRPQVGRLIIEQKLPGTGRSATVHWVYRIGAKETPDYLVFRGVSRSAVRGTVRSLPPLPAGEPPKTPESPAKKPPAKKKPSPTKKSAKS